VTVDAGAVWEDVVRAVAPEGLTALHGSSPDVGVVGYSLGGGMGWYARKLGLQTNSITGAEVVTADGSVVWADAEHHSELFWALRGGGGNFGVVTRLQFRAYDFSTTYGGMLVWDAREAEPVVRRWIDWAAGAPDEVTTACRVLNLPPIPAIPEPFRGRSIAVIDGAVLADDDRAAAILADLRALDPEIDTFARVPAASIARLHMDPEGPTPSVSGCSVLTGLPEPAMESFLALTGPGSGSSLLMAELRQLGGTLARPAPGAGALPQLEGEFMLFAVAVAMTPELAARGQADATALVDAMSPYSSQRSYLNFTESPVEVSASFPEAAWRRLTAIRSAVDPDGRLLANHAIRPASGDE
jgi:FAD/FMN-containing dehydrogenase